MQWILMLVGLVVGVIADPSLAGLVIGALAGLTLGLVFSLDALSRRNDDLERRLKAFQQRFEQGTQALYERLLTLEREAEAQPGEDHAAQAPATPTESDDPPAAERPEPAVAEQSPAHPAAPEGLRWNLDAVEIIAPAAPVPAEEPALAAREAVAPAALEPPAPRAAPGPSGLERALDTAQAWLFGGNTVLRIGVLLLFIGLAFLLRYASDRVVVPLELRYAGVALAAVALLGVGWWLRGRREAYGLLLQGTGVAVLYLTIFAAMRLHPLITPGTAMLLLVAVTLCSAILAILQNAMGLALAASLGGFAAPVLASTGSGSHIALFSYFALLNAGIFAIAWFKAWRLLNLVGFVGTFGIGFAWGLRTYTPELLPSTQAFLLLFFLMYVGIGLLFARRTLLDGHDAPDERRALLRWSARQGDYIDGTVLFGPPLIGFGLQCALVRHIEFGMAFSALALGLFYMLLAHLLHGHRSAARTPLLTEVCLALGVVFGTLAIPLALDARWTSAAWAVEGAGLYWLGLRQQRPLARIFALLLQLGAALAFLQGLRPGLDSLLLGSPLGALMLGSALLLSHRHARRSAPQGLPAWERDSLPLLACAGLAFLYLTAPLCFAVNATAIAWALAGLITLYIGLRLKARSFLFSAFAIQLLGGALFLLHLQGADDAGAVLGTGWRGLMSAALIGLALVASTLLAARAPRVREDGPLMTGLSLVLLLGLAFINLAVLFVLPWRLAGAVWAGSGLLILWLSLVLRLPASLYFGLSLQALGGVALLIDGRWLLDGLSGEGLTPLAHAGFWAPAALAVAALIGAWRLHRANASEQRVAWSDRSLRPLSQLLLAWGVGWWALTALMETVRFVAEPWRGHVLLLVAAVSTALLGGLARRAHWREAALLCLTLVPFAWMQLSGAWHYDYQPFAHLGWLAWPLVIVAHGLILRRLGALLPGNLLGPCHVIGCWLLLAVLALGLRQLFVDLAEHYNAWRWLGWALVPSAFLLLMASRRRLPWPVAAQPRDYRLIAALPVAAALLAWFWLANLRSDGAAQPLPYLPLVNPLELGLLIALFALYRWSQACLPQWLPETGLHRPRQVVFGASLFALLTLAVCRAAHHLLGVPFDTEALIASMPVQAGLSLLWTLCALGLMVFGTRRTQRETWMVGAGLIGLVVIKLFFVELGNSGSLERIVSFIGVGVLLLLIGYFSPLPPHRNATPTEPETP